jgi:drug/metabolite transporter (DMT)-like permease
VQYVYSSEGRVIVKNNALAAVLWVSASIAISTFMSVFARQLSSRIHALEITFFAILFGFLFLWPIILRHGRWLPQSDVVKLHFYRSISNSVSLSSWFLALTLLPLADATALNLLSPLCASLGAVLFLGERMGLRRWSALGVGLFGALVIVRPGFEHIGLGVGMVMLTVLGSAGQRILGKSVSRRDSAATCVFYLMLFMVPVSFVGAVFVWSSPETTDYLWLMLIGLLLMLAHITLIRGVRLLDVSALEPVNFLRLVWGALLGFLFFAEIPDVFTWIGGILIISGTSYIAFREARLRSSASRRKQYVSGQQEVL